MGKLGPMKGSSHLGEGYLGSFGGYSDGSSNRGGAEVPLCNVITMMKITMIIIIIRSQNSAPRHNAGVSIRRFH